MSYKIQNRSPDSKRIKIIKRTDGKVLFTGAPVPTFQENTIQAGWCLIANSPVPELTQPSTTFELTASPIGVDGRVSLYRNETLVSSMRYNNLSSNVDKVKWFNDFFGAVVLMAIIDGVAVFTIREAETVVKLVFEDDDIDYIFGDFQPRKDNRPAFFREQYRLAFIITEFKAAVVQPIYCDLESSDVFHFSDFNPVTLKAIVDAETGQVVMSSDDAFSNMFSNNKVQWEFDSNYGRGSIRNLTDKCLLIYFQKSEGLGDSDINAHITYVPAENATVLTIEGVYYISLAPVKYVAPILDYELMNDNGIIQNTSGGQAGNINIRFQLIERGPTNPAGVTFTYAGVEHTVLPGDILGFAVPRILPNTSLSENIYVVQNEITILTPDVTLDGYGLFDYDLWQTTNYWDEYSDRNDLQITVTANGVTTAFIGSREQMDDPSKQAHPSASIGTLMKIQAEAKWVGCAVQIGDVVIDGVILDSAGYVEFTIPAIATGLWDVKLINLDRIDERKFPSQNPVTRLRTVYFI